jgi:chromosome segregation ATPase
VEIDIRNDGPLAHNPARYGRTVTLHRRLEKLPGTGNITSVISIINKDARATVAKSTKSLKAGSTFGELELLRSALNLNPGNPVVAMDQELAKKLLQAGGQRLYAHYLEATGLRAEYDLILEAYNELGRAQANLAAGDEELKDAEEEASTAQRKLDKVRGLQEQQARLTEARHDEAWAQLRKHEAAVAEAEDAARAAGASAKKAAEADPRMEAAVKKYQADLEEAQ